MKTTENGLVQQIFGATGYSQEKALKVRLKHKIEKLG